VRTDSSQAGRRRQADQEMAAGLDSQSVQRGQEPGGVITGERDPEIGATRSR
jgi:hypothetical protein